tara:strand:+ start:25183 stop:27864 length:2682 start_codon:yes stop_codon:yes gene_type:complete
MKDKSPAEHDDAHEELAESPLAAKLSELVEVPRDTEAERVLSALRSKLFAKEQPAKLGRFLVIGRVGAGASGVVYSAYDPQLDRRVAIKLLRLGDASKRKRLEREAKAMAKLRCANVVAVHELGVADKGELFVVMELIDGTTLADWLLQEPRKSDQIISYLVDAGRGLAAAHSADLVHRDFKPENVLIAKDGGVRVADFGLAYSDGVLDDDEAEPATTSPMQLGSNALTRTGALVGTPNYMAPEVLQGKPADAASDQYSFCVTAYQALCGQLPYDYDSLAGLLEAIETQELRVPQAGAMPSWLWKILQRGLSAKASDRFADMPSLLQAIRTHQGKRRGGMLAAGAVALAVGIGVAIAWPGAAPENKALCTGSKTQIESVWNDAQRALVDTAFLASKQVHAEQTAALVGQELDRYSQDWAAQHQETCLATRKRGEQSEATMSLRMRCLERRRSELQALVNVLSVADAKVIDKAVRAAAELTPVLVCSDVEALSRAGNAPEDPRVVNELAPLRASLDVAKQQRQVGQYEKGIATARTVLAGAEQVKFEPFIAESRLVLGDLLTRAGQYDEALESLRQAFSEGLASGEDKVAAQAAIRATGLVGFRMHKSDEAKQWSWLAGTLLARLGEAVALEGTLATNQGNIAYASGDYERAARHFEDAVQLASQAHGADHLMVGVARMNLGATRRILGDLDESLKQLQLSKGILETSLGSKHPDLGRVLNSLGNLSWQRADYTAAERYHREALALKEAALGPGNPSIAHSCNNLADALTEQAKFQEAQRMFQRAHDIWQTTHGAEHAYVALAKRGVAQCQLESGDHQGASVALEEVLAMQLGLGVQDNHLAITRFLLARALWPTKAKRKRARALAQEANDTMVAGEGGQWHPRIRAWLGTHTL